MSVDAVGNPLPSPASARAVLGHGFALAAPAGQPAALDLVWQDGPQGGGPAWVEGVDNLAQDLAVALLTPLGSDPFNTGFGFEGLSVLTLDLGTALREQLLQVSIVRTLTADSRVAEVSDVVLEPLDLQRRQVVRVTVRTVLGQEVPMTLGEVDLG